MLNCLISASPILNEQGDYAGSFGMLTDISELKVQMKAKEKAVKDLRDLNQKLELVIDHRTKNYVTL